MGNLIHPVLLAMGLSPETKIVIGGGDTACATLAAGVVKQGDVCESVGTTNVLTVCMEEPKFSPNFHQPPPCGGWSLDLSGGYVPHRLLLPVDI